MYVNKVAKEGDQRANQSEHNIKQFSKVKTYTELDIINVKNSLVILLAHPLWLLPCVPVSVLPCSWLVFVTKDSIGPTTSRS